MSVESTRASSPVPPRRLLLAVFGATFFVRFGFGLALSIFASYILGRSTGLDPTGVGVVGIVSAMAPIGEFSTVLFSGTAADRYGRFPVLLVGMVGAGLLLGLVSLTRNPFALAGMNLLFGVGSGGILAASLAVVADEADPSETGYQMGRFDAVNLLGWIVGFATGFGLLGTVPTSALPWVFRGGAALLLVGVAYTFRTIRGHREPTLKPQFDLRGIVESVRRPGVLLVTLPWLVIYMLLGVAAYTFRTIRGHREPTLKPQFDLRGIVESVRRPGVLLVTLPWLVIYMLLGVAFAFLGTAATGLGVSPIYLAALIGGGGLLLLATQPYFGHLADRFGRMRLMSFGTVGFVGVLVCAGLLQAWGPHPVLLGFTALSALVALSYGPAALAALADLSLLLTRATTMAIYTLTISLGMFVGLGVATSLYSLFGGAGLDGFFAAVGVSLVALTYLRYLRTRQVNLPGAI